ncbi:universal stress protein [Haloplanus aerogenes]|uniref:Universal stress protein n=1 Tax=Haloplanus aerogenes TaxID=660522 RepID=A0A3M0CWS6_9EURY|nr:universal stress protein [Haloplanus aerogenes]AZH25135.1 universal stress protein [Haloplanus aerogenes]RMB13638.1 universal stress protein family protein [Haloplanus aerogenes]
MYNVVIGVDDNEERAMACARAVADLPGDAAEKRVTVLHSFTDNPSGASASQIASVRDVVDFFEDRGVDVEVTESSGDPADQILDAAEEMGADLIVVSGRKRSPTGKALFGSVTQTVILNAKRPVMVAGDTDD